MAQKEIEISQKVTIFPEDPEMKKEVVQRIKIDNDEDWIYISHDDNCLSMSLVNFFRLSQIIEKALSSVDM